MRNSSALARRTSTKALPLSFGRRNPLAIDSIVAGDEEEGEEILLFDVDDDDDVIVVSEVDDDDEGGNATGLWKIPMEKGT